MKSRWIIPYVSWHWGIAQKSQEIQMHALQDFDITEVLWSSGKCHQFHGENVNQLWTHPGKPNWWPWLVWVVNWTLRLWNEENLMLVILPSQTVFLGYLEMFRHGFTPFFVAISWVGVWWSPFGLVFWTIECILWQSNLAMSTPDLVRWFSGWNAQLVQGFTSWPCLILVSYSCIMLYPHNLPPQFTIIPNETTIESLSIFIYISYHFPSIRLPRSVKSP